jgi:hypothetical protein
MFYLSLAVKPSIFKTQLIFSGKEEESIENKAPAADRLESIST